MSALSLLFDAVVETSLRCTFLIGLWLIARPFLRGRVPAYLIFAAWVVIGVRLVVPFAIPARWSPYNVANAWTRAEQIERRGDNSKAALEPANVSAAQGIVGAPSTERRLAPIFSTSPIRSSIVDTKSILMWIWAAGVIGLALI